MSKRALKTYISKLSKKALEEQLLELYEKFPTVKTYYDFAFNPKEDKLVQEAKTKISNEYFPLKRKRPKARRSVAQKYLKHFKKLGVDPYLIADIMCYNLEIAQTFSREKNVPDAFYKSMLNSFIEVIQFTTVQGVFSEFKERILKIYSETQTQQWLFEDDFSKALDIVD
jgi:Zn-dependent M32 family carboxypeptidase